MTTITTEWKEEYGTFNRYTSYDGKLPYPGNPDLSIDTGANPDEFRIEFPGTTDMGESCYIEASVMVGFLDHHDINTTANDLRAQLAEANQQLTEVTTICNATICEREELIVKLATRNDDLARAGKLWDHTQSALEEANRTIEALRSRETLECVYAKGYCDGYQDRDRNGGSVEPGNRNPYEGE